MDFARPSVPSGQPIQNKVAEVSTSIPTERAWNLAISKLQEQGHCEIAALLMRSDELKQLENMPARGPAYLRQAPRILNEIVHTASIAIDRLIENLQAVCEEFNDAQQVHLQVTLRMLRKHQECIIDFAHKFQDKLGDIPQEIEQLTKDLEQVSEDVLSVMKSKDSSLAALLMAVHLGKYQEVVNQINGPIQAKRIQYVEAMSGAEQAVKLTEEGFIEAWRELNYALGINPKDFEDNELEGLDGDDLEIAKEIQSDTTTASLIALLAIVVVAESSYSIAQLNIRLTAIDSQLGAELFRFLPADLSSLANYKPKGLS